MFGLFKKKSEADKLREKYNRLISEAHKLSTTDRTASDAKTAEANAIMDQLEALENGKK